MAAAPKGSDDDGNSRSSEVMNMKWPDVIRLTGLNTNLETFIKHLKPVKIMA